MPSKKKLQKKMKDASEGEGRTVLFVSHNMDSIESICPNAVLMSKGSIISEGSSKDVINEYLHQEQKESKKFQGKRTWPEHELPGNELIKLREVSTRNSMGNSITQLNITEEMSINFDYEVFSDDMPIGFSMVLTNNQNVILCSMDEHVDFEWHEQPNHKKGRFLNSCKIKPNTLNSGIHNISIWCYSPPLNPNAAPHVLQHNVLSFEIIDNQIAGSVRGSFPYDWHPLPATRPKLFWNKQQL